MKIFLLAGTMFLSMAASASAAGVINAGTYTQNFNTIGTALPNGWSIYSTATATALGTVASYTMAATSWGVTSPTFRNSASTTGLTSSSGSTPQANSANRALSISQGGVFGNPGASFDFNFSTLGVTVTTISFDALMLRVAPASSTWSIQYGIGANPTSWTTIGSYADPGVWGSTTLTYTVADFGSHLDNQSNVWFRFVALSATTGGTTYDNIGIDNFSLTAAAAVPEPSACFLLGGCGFMLLIWGRRKKTLR